MIFQKHTYVFPKTYLCFFKNIPMFFQKHTCVFSEKPCALRYALCLRQMRQLSPHGAMSLSPAKMPSPPCIVL